MNGKKKVKYFIYDDPSPFGSEFVFDRTAFESTHAIAKYAIKNPMQPDTNLWFDKNLEKWYSHPKIEPGDAYDFLERQIAANIAMRGWLEPTYYWLGSATVGAHSLDYMSQMAGWSILDYALFYAKEPSKYARLGYASILSSWVLVNSGTEKSNYGYWYPGQGNDGAVGWAFSAEKFGTILHDLPNGRGIWFVDGEIDHGLTGGVRAAATVVVDDPIFGKFAYGGTLTEENNNYYVIPRDGVRRRLHLRSHDHRFYLKLYTDSFLKEHPIVLKDDMTEIEFKIENKSQRAHSCQFIVSGLPLGNYDISINKKNVSALSVKNKEEIRCKFEVGSDAEYLVLIRKISN